MIDPVFLQAGMGTVLQPNLSHKDDTDRTILHRRHHPPSEVWATIFDYAGQGAVPLRLDQISRSRLLSRSITAGLDEWNLRGMDQGVKKDGSLRLVQANPQGTAAPIQVQKRALLSVSKASTEFLRAVTSVQDDITHQDVEQLPSFDEDHRRADLKFCALPTFQRQHR